MPSAASATGLARASGFGSTAGPVMLDEPTASLEFGNQGRVLRETGAWPKRVWGAVHHARPEPDAAPRRRRAADPRRRHVGAGLVHELIDVPRLRALYSAEVEDPARRRVCLPS